MPRAGTAGTNLLIAAILAAAVALAALPWSLPDAPMYVCAPQQGVVVCQPMDGR